MKAVVKILLLLSLFSAGPAEASCLEAYSFYHSRLSQVGLSKFLGGVWGRSREVLAEGLAAGSICAELGDNIAVLRAAHDLPLAGVRSMAPKRLFAHLREQHAGQSFSYEDFKQVVREMDEQGLLCDLEKAATVKDLEKIEAFDLETFGVFRKDQFSQTISDYLAALATNPTDTQ